MHRSLVCIGILTIAMMVGSPPARAADNALTAEMAPFNYLIGSWNCSTSVPAMNGRPAHTDPTTVTFEVVPGNVFHDHVASAYYSGDDYFGYSAKMKMYWNASADNSGAHSFTTSTDGKTYSGTGWMGPATMSVTTTYTKVSPSNATMHEVISGGGVQATIDSSCTH